MPGYDNVPCGPAAALPMIARAATILSTWQAAIARNPNWIFITSFNEWPEGTYIEPSAAFGRTFSGHSRGLEPAVQGRRRSGDRPRFARGRRSCRSRSGGRCAAARAGITNRFVEAPLLNLRAGPGTKFEIVGQANAGTALPIDGRYSEGDEWWRVDTGDAQGWVYGPLVRAAGPLDAVATIAFEPQPVANEAPDADGADEGLTSPARFRRSITRWPHRIKAYHPS